MQIVLKYKGMLFCAQDSRGISTARLAATADGKKLTVTNKRQADEILAALDGLPDGYRVLLAEHYFHNVPLVVSAALAGYSSRASASEAHRRALRHLRTYSKYKSELRACLDAFEEVTPYLSAAGNTGAGSYIRTGISSTEGAAIAGI